MVQRLTVYLQNGCVGMKKIRCLIFFNISMTLRFYSYALDILIFFHAKTKKLLKRHHGNDMDSFVVFQATNKTPQLKQNIINDFKLDSPKITYFSTLETN